MPRGNLVLAILSFDKGSHSPTLTSGELYTRTTILIAVIPAVSGYDFLGISGLPITLHMDVGDMEDASQTHCDSKASVLSSLSLCIQAPTSYAISILTSY